MGSTDRVIRIIVAVVIAGLFFYTSNFRGSCNRLIGD